MILISIPCSFLPHSKAGKGPELTETKLLPHSSHVSRAQHPEQRFVAGTDPPDGQRLVQCTAELLADSLPTTVHR